MITQIYEYINIFSASLPYYAQAKKFQETKNSEGYSLKVSLLILTSCILRIFFWFGNHFHWSLLAQAVLLIITHIWLINEAVKCKNYQTVSDYITENKNKYEESEINTLISGNTKETSNGIQKEYLQLKNPSENLKLIKELNKDEKFINKKLFLDEKFFNWKQFNFYAYYLVILVIVISTLYTIFGVENKIFNNTIGVFSSIIEGSMSAPQIYEIIKTKNVDNLSVTLIACWFIGDFIKTIYFFTSPTPFQFKLLGIVQITLNFIIVFLYLKYKNNKNKKL